MENELPKEPSRLPFLFIGLIVGLLIAGALWVIVKGGSDTQEAETATNVLSLEITSPAESLATSQNTLTVSGNTGVPSVVTVTGPSETKIISSDNASFSTSVELTEGKNIIDVVTYDPTTGVSEHETREVLYLDEDLSSL